MKKDAKKTGEKGVESAIKQFVRGTLKLDQVMHELGKSRATIYRYAKMIERGEEIFDKRSLGNNRKYGKKD